jgi:hypothetical protein
METVIGMLPEWVPAAVVALVGVSTAVTGFLAWYAPRSANTIDDKVLKALLWMSANVFKYVPRLTVGAPTPSVAKEP